MSNEAPKSEWRVRGIHFPIIGFRVKVVGAGCRAGRDCQPHFEPGALLHEVELQNDAGRPIWLVSVIC